MSVGDAVIWSAGWLVPGQQREEWLAEWRAEACYVRRVRGAGAVRFCLGAFRDAWWLRKNAEERGRAWESPLRCMAALAVVALAGLCAVFALPLARKTVQPSRYGTSKDLVLISSPRGVSFEQYQSLRRHAGGRFVMLSFDRAGGLVLGQVRPSAVHPAANWLGEWLLAVPNDAGGFDYCDCSPAAARVRRPLVALITALVYCCIFLPATTSFKPGLAGGARAWLFLLAKAACILPALFCVAVLAVSYAAAPYGPTLFIAVFPGSLVAFRWAWLDQQRRCPVCLRRLSKPVGFGEASHTFLGWYGDELTCVLGHGVLRVPEIPSSFSMQRWTDEGSVVTSVG